MLVIALLSAASAIPAAAQCMVAGNNTYCGTGAGAGATGNGVSAFGFDALNSGDSGDGNTATGTGALQANTTGSVNTATGYYALGENTTGNDNTATGPDALFANTTGGSNTATGFGALKGNTTGDGNIAVGDSAGQNLTTGDNNIDIGNGGVAAESDTIRIGTQGTQTAAYIAGISTTAKIKKGCEVVVETSGLLGCVKSSARYKRDIRDMGNASDKLMKLRPVTFRYKTDPTGTQQYGLIAEEVEQVYPELVIDDAQGKADTVAYQMLPAMLLNEVQKEARENKRKDARIAALQNQVAAQQGQIDALTKKGAQIDALVERVNAFEGQARLSVPQRLAAVGADSAPRLR
ncbi:MAG: tail fiber domain-containing protein [Candidatus Binataceae bacterium]